MIMTAGEKIKHIVKVCKAEVDITFNANTSSYMTVKEYIENDDRYEDVEARVKNRMCDTDSMVEVYFYPDTPVGPYHIAHYDLEMALDEAIEILKDQYER